MHVLTRFSLKNPVVVAILVALVAVGGILSALGLKEELMPNIALPVIAVVTPYPGASPSEVASNVTTPLENALDGISGVKTVTSTSVENVSEISLELNMNADLNTVEQKVQQTVNQVILPQSALRPTVQKFSFDASPVVYFTVSGSQVSEAQLRDTVNHTLIPALQGVAGVASVQASGAEPDVVSIQFDASKLRHYGLSMQQVVQDVQADDSSIPSGTATVGGIVHPVQVNGAFHSLRDIRNLQIPVPVNPAAGIASVGDQMKHIGSAVGQIGQSVSQLGQAVGALAAENQLISGIQSIQGQLFGAELALARQLAEPKSSQNPLQIAELQTEIQALQNAENSLQQKLKQVQSSLPTSSAGIAGQATGTGGANASTGVAATPSRSPSVSTVALSDLATVALKTPTDGAINRTNGEPSVLVSVTQTEDANTVDMANAVNQKLSELKASLPQGMHIQPFFDAAKMITASVNGMLREAVLGALFAILVILLFLRNWRTTLIAVVSIPLSLMMAILLLGRFHITLNIMTLGGLAVATGRVVDDSIVVIENIYRTWRRGFGLGQLLVLYGTREVGQAIASSTLTTMAVFVPLGLVTGVVGKIFLPFALTVVFSLISSLFVALTVVPLLAWLLVARRPAPGGDYAWLDGALLREGALHPSLPSHGKGTGKGTGDSDGAAWADTFDRTPAVEPASPESIAVLQPWQRAYRRGLAWCLDHKLWVLLLTAAAFVASILVLPLAGSTFIPESQDKYATVSVQMPIGTDRPETNAEAARVEQIILNDRPTVTRMNTQIGSDPSQASSGGGITGSNEADFFLELQSDTNVPQFVDKLRAQLRPVTGQAVIQVKELILGGASTGFGLVVTGSNAHDVTLAANRVTDRLKSLSGLANVESNVVERRPQLTVTPLAQKAAHYGLTTYQISSLVQQVLTNQKIGEATINGINYDLTASLKPTSAVDSVAALKSLPLATPTGQTVKLSDVADVKVEQVPASILHRDGQQYAEVTGDFSTKNTGRTTKEALQAVRQLHLPSDVQVQLSGDSQQQNQSFSQLIEAILVAVGMVYVVMLIAFGEWSAPFAILFSMPVALIGAFFGTVIGGQPVSVSSLIGILMLMGIVVTNAIVLVARVEQQRAIGQSTREALLEAGTTRLRPILMTAIATICALLPLAFGFAEGSLISQGLAVVVIGGLVTSTALTLVIVPVIYELLHFRRIRESR